MDDTALRTKALARDADACRALIGRLTLMTGGCQQRIHQRE